MENAAVPDAPASADGARRGCSASGSEAAPGLPMFAGGKSMEDE